MVSHPAPVHLVSAKASAQHLVLVLVQEAVDRKDNEITTLPTMLNRLELTGQTVTIDAMGCQKKIAAQIFAGKADFVLALKANHPDLLRDFTDCFTMATTPDQAKRTVEKNYGQP